MKNWKEKTISIAEENGWSVNINEEYGERDEFSFGKYSDAGQDFNFTVIIPKDGTLEDLVDEICDYWEAFDVSYEAYIWLDGTGHGRNGAPYDMRDVYDDMESMKNEMKGLFDALSELNSSYDEDEDEEVFVSDESVVPIVPQIMKIDTNSQTFHMDQIDHRKFMFSPKDHLLILGKQYDTDWLISSYAVEMEKAGMKEYDQFICGWVGVGGDYPYGIIHFAPNVVSENTELFNMAFDALEMFRGNGAVKETVVRGLGKPWEQPMSAIFPED